MKDYKEVVKDRYGASPRHPYDSQYSLMNPVGFYGLIVFQRAFFRIMNRIREGGLDITKAGILDIGSGNGYWTRFFAELAESPANICGVEMSEQRLNNAKRLNPAIRYVKGDFLDEKVISELGPRSWDIISAMTVFMHFDPGQLEKAWGHVNDLLKPGGYFIFLEAHAKRHSASPHEADSSGFNPKEVREMASRHAFQEVLTIRQFKRYGNFQSRYLAGRIPMDLHAALEAILPGPPGNFITLLRKVDREG